MRGEVSFKPGGGHRLLDDASDVAIAEPAALEDEWRVAATREGEASEERAAVLEARFFDPPPERRNGADRRFGREGNRDGFAAPFLVGLRTADVKGEAAVIKDKVVEVERDDLRTPECSRKAQEEDRTVPDAPERPVVDRDKGFAEEFDGEGALALRGDAVFAGDTSEDVGNERVSGRGGVAVLAVPKGDRGCAALDRCRLERPVQPAGETREVSGDGLWGGRECCESGLFAVVGEMGPVAGILEASAGTTSSASIPLRAFDISIVGYKGSRLHGLNFGRHGVNCGRTARRLGRVLTLAIHARR